MSRKTKKTRRRSSERERMLRLHESTKDRLNKLVCLWKDRLWLSQWRITAVWEWNGIGATDVPVPAGAAVLANCDADWRYLHATVRFDIPECSARTPEELERTVIHELLHAVVHEMRDWEIEHEERVVTHLTNVIERLHKR